MDKPAEAYYHNLETQGGRRWLIVNLRPGRLLLLALSTGPHCRAARKILEELRAPFDLLEVDLLPEPERERALAEMTVRNPAQTFPTLLGGSRTAAGPLPDDFIWLAARFAPGPGPARPDSRPQAARGAAAGLYETLAPAQAAQGYVFNPDPDWTLEALAGLLVNEARHGYGSCPGRLATGLPERDRDIICPCAFRAEDVAKYGRCHCHLYFSPRAAEGRVTPVPDRWLR
jgi:ferredoxin-thioredoxin reductase catalytic subunit/glutaredoxin